MIEVSGIILDDDELDIVLKALNEYAGVCRGGASFSNSGVDKDYFDTEELNALDLHFQLSSYKDKLNDYPQ